LQLVFRADGHGIQALEVVVDRFVDDTPGGEIGAGFLQRDFQLALP
jgi:hypothetical protein